MTHILFILDRSGSMNTLCSDAIGGFNAFLGKQQALCAELGEAQFSLILFDNLYEVPFPLQPITTVPPLTAKTFVPRGSTALLDAIGRTLDEHAAHIATLPAAQRPQSVIIAILTDGEENASTQFTRPAIANKITHFRELLGWEFIFLAANQDAIATATTMAIPAADATNLSFASAADVSESFMLAESMVTEKRRKVH